MATYKCVECGHIFEDGEQAEWVEMHGFTYGNGERFDGCPLCMGGYKKTTPCKSCGTESFFEDEMQLDVCKDCFDEYTKNFEFCVRIGAKEEESVAINGAIASLWSADEINEILIEEAKKNKDVSFEKFANFDKGWFAEMISDEVEK